MTDSGTFKIRPAGRHLRTIGSDLIQNQYAAVIELIKNAYDADSPEVTVAFKGIGKGEKRKLQIVISDGGHGMSRDTVINKWLVPSTSDKLLRGKSPKGRVMQGRKGIGRYAASILGQDLLLETIAESEETVVYVEWDKFDEAKYLDDVEILVETRPSKGKPGTTLTINDSTGYKRWLDKGLGDLKDELKKLVSPIRSVDEVNHSDDFAINLVLDNFYPNQEGLIREVVEPYPIFELYDYRISGSYSSDGRMRLKYESQKAKGIPSEDISADYGIDTGCGSLLFDIRVYDREKDAIAQLIGRGLRNENGEYLDTLHARSLLNEYNGIGVYRNGFRIRPLGDPDFDWLELNDKRIQNPSMKIGSNQVIGLVQIQSEELSHLEETSARDGLKETVAYRRLQEITLEVIQQLERRRFKYRQKAGLSRPALKVERELERLFSFDELKAGIRKTLVKKGLGVAATDEIIKIIATEEEEKNKIAEDLRSAVAVYQGQATMGKIVNVVLHEGRRPLSYFKNQIPNLTYWMQDFKKTKQLRDVEKIGTITEGIVRNSDVLASLFGRIDPLAAGKRGAKKNINLKKVIEDMFRVFSVELTKHKIKHQILGADELVLQCWPQDIYVIFANLIDNSIYWIASGKSVKRTIEIKCTAGKGALRTIDYRDTGPGIDSKFIEDGVIFEPGFTTKAEGTGLGLPIAGEAAARCGWELRALASDSGAYFRLVPKGDVAHD
jgi:signal transduction histidine kinase